MTRPLPPRQSTDYSQPLHPAQLPRGWEEEQPQPIVRRVQADYVPPGRQTIDMPAVRLADPSLAVEAGIVPAATVDTRVIGSHLDRASAWLRYALPLCLSVAAVATIMAVALRNVPLLSWSALLIFGGIFVAAYAGLLLHYWHTSPEGVALSHTRDLWRFLRAEQSHRHRIEREAWQDQRQLTRSDRERQERRHDR